MSIVIGSWGIPLGLSAFAWIWAIWPRESDKKNGDYDFSFWIPAAFRLCAAIIMTLAFWLLWSVFR